MKREPASAASAAMGITASTNSPSGYSSGVPTAPTGRPPMWTRSAQRKMTRLYVYTTLPLNKILNVIYAHAPDSAPGPDSANKKLNSLLDKEPRWLRPRTETEVAQRLEQLANSPSRIKAARESDFTLSSSFSGQPGRAPRASYSPMFNADVKPEPSASASPPSLEVAAVRNWALGPTADDPWLSDALYFANDDYALPTAAASADDPFVDHGGSSGGVFDPFLRKTTFMSASTNDTSGSLQQILHDYSEPYVHAVRRLMRRFTAPVVERRSNSPSPDRGSAVQSWLDDDDSPASFRNRPYPLPGDFLSLDLVALQEECHPGSLVHAQRRCMCYAQADEFAAPWVTADGFTPRGERLLNRVVLRSEVGVSDAFRNTILHFLAARGSMDALLYALQAGICAGIIDSTNSAGQTFLHVLSRSWMQNINYLCQLLEVLATMDFNMDAVDHYGRNFLHVLLSERIAPADFRRVVELCDPAMQRKRDAFNVTPAPQPVSADDDGTVSMDVDSSSDQSSPSMSPESKSDPIVARESQLLRHVRAANQDPAFEDDEGRNGLHCLAMATLSMKSVVDKCNLASPSASSPSDKPIKKRPAPTNKPDSSKDRMNLRLGIVTNLLDAGVDPNHYDMHGNTPLMAFAAELPEDDDYKIGPAILTLLISRGAEVNARNRAGETALHIAVRCGRKLAVKTLVNKRANVHARDAGGRGVLDVADTKLMGSRDEDPREYAHYEACRAWLSGRGQAVQDPSVSQEWGSR